MVDESVAASGGACCSSGLALLKRACCAGEQAAANIKCVVGCSLENGYFSAGRLAALLAWAVEHFPAGVVVMLPDGPAEHTYRAFGYSLEKSRAKSDRHGRNLYNKIRRGVDALPDQKSRGRVRVLDWRREVEPCGAYAEALTRARAAYNGTDGADDGAGNRTPGGAPGRVVGGFKAEVNAATAQVVGRISNPMPIDAGVGAECLLMELAFLECLAPIIAQANAKARAEAGAKTEDSAGASDAAEGGGDGGAVDHFVFVYHKPWPVFCRFVEEYARLASPATLGFLCVREEAVKEEAGAAVLGAAKEAAEGALPTPAAIE